MSPTSRGASFLAKHSYLLIYFLLALVITWSLLKPGYVVSLDTAFTPSWHRGIANLFWGYEDPIYGGYLVQHTPLALFSLVLPPEFVQKGYIFLIFFLAGVTAHRMVPGLPQPARYYAGLLYVLNPFVYIKAIVGSWQLLAAYALLPLFLWALLALLERPNLRRTAVAALAAAAISINIHIAALGLLLLVCLTLFRAVGAPRAIRRPLLGHLTLLGGLSVLLNAYWLVPLLTAQPGPLSTITEQDLASFAPRSVDFGTAFTIASMHGYWASGYSYTRDSLPLWPLLLSGMLFLAIYGAVTHHHRWWVRGLALAWLLALVLGSGLSGPFAGPVRELFAYLPVFKGLRETYKLVAVLVLVYSALGALGVAEVWGLFRSAEGSRRFTLGLLSMVMLALPVAYSYGMFGFQGQLRPSSFPAEWYQVNELLSQDPDDVHVLFLPWHQFMGFRWVQNRNQTIASPESFFVKRTIYAQNLEVGGVDTPSSNPGQRYVDNLLRFRAPQLSDLGSYLVPLGVRYIVLAKEADYSSYGYLYAQRDLELLLDGEYLALFRNRHPVGRVYRVDGPKVDGQGWTPLPFEEESPVRFRVAEGVGSQMAFVAPNLDARDWRYQGVEEVLDEAAFVGFYRGQGDIVLTYRRFTVFLMGYALTLLGLAGVAGTLVLRKQGRVNQEAPRVAS